MIHPDALQLEKQMRCVSKGPRYKDWAWFVCERPGRLPRIEGLFYDNRIYSIEISP